MLTCVQRLTIGNPHFTRGCRRRRHYQLVHLQFRGDVDVIPLLLRKQTDVQKLLTTITHPLPLLQCERVDACNPPTIPASGTGFVDDVNALAFGKLTKENCTIVWVQGRVIPYPLPCQGKGRVNSFFTLSRVWAGKGALYPTLTYPALTLAHPSARLPGLKLCWET